VQSRSGKLSCNRTALKRCTNLKEITGFAAFSRNVSQSSTKVWKELASWSAWYSQVLEGNGSKHLLLLLLNMKLNCVMDVCSQCVPSRRWSGVKEGSFTHTLMTTDFHRHCFSLTRRSCESSLDGPTLIHSHRAYRSAPPMFPINWCGRISKRLQLNPFFTVKTDVVLFGVMMLLNNATQTYYRRRQELPVCKKGAIL